MSGIFLFFKQKTAYEMRISDWSSDVCSSDLFREFGLAGSFVRHCQQFYHLPTSDPFRQCGDEPVEGLTIRLPWEELVTIDQLQERHGFAPQAMDDVPIIDHMAVGAVIERDRKSTRLNSSH